MPIRPPIFRPRFAPAPRPDPRPNAHQRGYGRAHERWRKQVLLAHPICRRCEASGLTVAALIAHHLWPVEERPDLRFAVDNGCGTCDTCHNQLHHGEPREVERFRDQMRQRGIGISEPGAKT